MGKGRERGTWWERDINLVISLVFHILKQGDLLVMLADFPVLKTSRLINVTDAVTVAVTIWGPWKILSIYWKRIFNGRNRRNQPVGFQYCTHKFLKANH